MTSLFPSGIERLFMLFLVILYYKNLYRIMQNIQITSLLLRVFSPAVPWFYG